MPFKNFTTLLMGVDITAKLAGVNSFRMYSAFDMVLPTAASFSQGFDCSDLVDNVSRPEPAGACETSLGRKSSSSLKECSVTGPKSDHSWFGDVGSDTGASAGHGSIR